MFLTALKFIHLTYFLITDLLEIILKSVLERQSNLFFQQLKCFPIKHKTRGTVINVRHSISEA